MAEEWIIKVQGKEYGPVDVPALLEWKDEGRVIPSNDARRADENVWTVAAEIPGLFETTVLPPPVQIEHSEQQQQQRPQRTLRDIVGQTFSIYRRGFFSFLGLTLLLIGPSVCAQATAAFINGAPGADVDLVKAAAGAFAVCMTMLTLALWPIYVAGIQTLSVELSAGNRVGFLGILNTAVKFWPRLAGLSLVVYGIFFLLLVFALAIAAMILAGAGSLLSIFVALALLAFQVWLFGRWFINTLFWQQTAVIENADPVDALRLSKQVARSGQDLPWYRRPLWRGVLIASIWVAFAMAIDAAAAWPTLQQSFETFRTAQSSQALIDAMKAAQDSHGFDLIAAAFGIVQAILRPLLGIAFVLLYLDSRFEKEKDPP